MRRKGIPKKRIGPEPGTRERSIRARQVKVIKETLNAAQKSAYCYMSTSLCDIEKKRNKNRKGGDALKSD